MCRGCGKQFTVTSGTLFANHKLPLKKYLLAIALYSNAAKGISALKLSRELNIQYKTAFVLLHKMRDALLLTRDESPLTGVCEMDGAYVNGYVRPANCHFQLKVLHSNKICYKHKEPSYGS